MAKMTFLVPESTSSTSTQTVILPNFKGLTSVTVNTGNVSYSMNGSSLTFTVSSGTPTRSTQSSYTPSKTASSSQSTTGGASAPSFPSSVSYNDGVYSGSLSKSGGPSSVLESGSAGGSKSASTTGGGSGTAGDCSAAAADAYNGAASSVSYGPDAQGYSGTLSKSGYSMTSCRKRGTGDDSDYIASISVTYSGTVTKPDTRVYRWTQGYSGTVYGTTQYYTTYYYAYTITVEYVDNFAPVLSMQVNGDPVPSGTTHPLTEPTDYHFVFSATDQDAADTLTYTILLGNNTRVPVTTLGKGVPITHDFLFSEMAQGNNTITVKVADSFGATVTYTLTIRNKVIKDWTLKDLYDIMNALGYTKTSYRSLNDLKPAGYNKSTISIAEIYQFLQ